MKAFKKSIVTATLLMCTGSISHLQAETHHEAKIAPGVYDLPLKIPKSLESRRKELSQDCLAAQKNIREFAERNGWEKLTESPLVEAVEIYATKEDFDKAVCELSPELIGKPIPTTFSAAVEKNVFYAVTPEVYHDNNPKEREEQAYVKLLTHELAHRLETRIVNGNEDKMGPIWFFEGFAVYVADQYRATLPTLSEAEVWAIVNAKERGSYPKYKAVFIHFLKDVTIQEYVTHAGNDDFIAWLQQKTGH
jgi:hypothetical protein